MGVGRKPILGHISFGVTDLERAGRFYDAVLKPIGWRRDWTETNGIGFGEPGAGELALFANAAARPPGPGFHLAFNAPSRAAVDAFWRRWQRAGRRRAAWIAAALRTDVLRGICVRSGRLQAGSRPPGVGTEFRFPMEQRLSLVTLGVADLERSRRFYEDGLGWRHKGDGAGVFFFQSPGMIIALWLRDELAKDAGLSSEGSGFAGIALAHNVSSRGAVDAVLAEAAAAGAKIVKPAVETFWGGYSAYFADPDGHLWEVAHNPFWSFDAAGGMRLPD